MKHENLVLSLRRVDKCQITTEKDSVTDVSSDSPSSEQIESCLRLVMVIGLSGVLFGL